MRKLEQEIREGNYQPVYLIYGPEDFLRQQCKKKLVEALGGEDAPNYTYREGPGTDEEEIRILAETVPFLAEKRLILLENTGWTKKGGQALAGDLESLPDTTVLVLVEREADAKNPLFKAIQSRGRCIACEALGEGEIKASLRKSFEEEGYEIDGRTLEAFINRCGTDLSRLAGEKEKLLAYTLEKRQITLEDVEAITHQTLRDRIFDMVDAAAAGNPRKAFRLYEDLKALKESPGRMLSLMTSQIGRLYVLRELDERGLNQKEMAGITRYHPYVIQKSLSACRVFTASVWRRKWEKLLGYDYARRQGKLEDLLAVEMALVEMSLR